MPTENCIALAHDAWSDATSDQKSPVDKLIVELRPRIERRGVVVPIFGKQPKNETARAVLGALQY